VSGRIDLGGGDGPRWAPSWTVLLTPLLPLLAALPGGRWALPLLAPLTLYPAFAARVRARDYLGAWSLGIAWAMLLSLGVILLVVWMPEAARAGILHGEAYRREMFAWVATGDAPENHPAVFIPQHLLHLGLFLLLTWISGGYLGLAMGAVLVDFMSYFVASFAVASGHPALGAVAAWVPWSVLRVAAFVLLGALFSRPLLVRRAWPFTRLDYQLMTLAACGLLADILIKAALAPAYGRFLRQMARSAGLG
jgi:hypothetical protein